MSARAYRRSIRASERQAVSSAALLDTGRGNVCRSRNGSDDRIPNATLDAIVASEREFTKANSDAPRDTALLIEPVPFEAFRRHLRTEERFQRYVEILGVILVGAVGVDLVLSVIGLMR